MPSDEIEHRAIAQQTDALLGRQTDLPSDRFGWLISLAVILLMFGVLTLFVFLLIYFTNKSV